MKALTLPLFFARNPLLPFAVAAVLGIIAADLMEVPWWMPALVALGSALIFYRSQARSLVALVVLAVTTFATLHAIQGERAHLFPLAPLLTKQHSLPVAARGTLVEINHDALSSSPPTGVFKLEELQAGSKKYSSWHRLRVTLPLPDANLPLAAGDHLQLNGSLHPLAKPRNPGQFNLADTLRRRGIVAELVVFSSNDIKHLPPHAGFITSALAVAARSRHWIVHTITGGLQNSPDVTAVLRAMVLGNREQTPAHIEESFRNSGSLHIFAVSGLHVGILAFIIWQFLKLLGLRRSLAALIVIPCLFYYALLTGWRPSAVRAAIMTSIFLAGFGLQRQPRILNSLAAAALVILLYDTQQLFMPGFQLSFVVLASIALFARPLQRPFKKWLAPDPFLPKPLISPPRRAFTACGEKAVDLAAISAAAWLGSAPFVLWHFGLVTPVALLANCVLVPIAFFVLALATLSLLSAGAGLATVSVIFNNANWCLAHVLLAGSSTFAALPGSHFYFDHLPLTSSTPDCRITILDTGAGGGAQLIECSTPTPPLAWLIDAGSKNAYFDIVRPLLRQRGWRQVDAFIVSHGDSRHLGAAPDLIRDFPPRYVFESPLPNTSPFYRDSSLALASLHVPLIQLTTNDTLNEPADTPSLSLRTLYPPPDHQPSAHADDQCLVLQLHYHGWRILFMSDSGFATEKWLLDNVPGNLPSHILVKGRHASDFSGLPEFISAVSPLVTVSTDASFPPEEQIPPAWKKLLTRKGITLFDQSQTGAVEIQCHPDRLELRGFVNGQSFTARRNPQNSPQ